MLPSSGWREYKLADLNNDGIMRLRSAMKAAVWADALDFINKKARKHFCPVFWLIDTYLIVSLPNRDGAGLPSAIYLKSEIGLPEPVSCLRNI